MDGSSSNSGTDIIMEQAKATPSASTEPRKTNGKVAISKSLNSRQEQRLVDYVEEEMIRISGEFKKRSLPTSSLRTLPEYLATIHHLLSLVMLLPPLTPSARALRVGMMLRLTGEALDSVVGYAPDVPQRETEPISPDKQASTSRQTGRSPSNQRILLSFLNDLDKAWLAILRNQSWDAEKSTGKDLDLQNKQTSADTAMEIDDPTSEALSHRAPTFSISQTDRARLRSLLISGTEKLEEWLPNISGFGGDLRGDNSDSDSDADLEEVDIDGLALNDAQQEQNPPFSKGLKETLEAMDEREMFNDIFWKTLTDMGELS